MRILGITPQASTVNGNQKANNQPQPNSQPAFGMAFSKEFETFSKGKMGDILEIGKKEGSTIMQDFAFIRRVENLFADVQDGKFVITDKKGKLVHPIKIDEDPMAATTANIKRRTAKKEVEQEELERDFAAIRRDMQHYDQNAAIANGDAGKNAEAAIKKAEKDITEYDAETFRMMEQGKLLTSDAIQKRQEGIGSFTKALKDAQTAKTNYEKAKAVIDNFFE